MQMNYKISGQFEHLYPVTLGDNVKLNNGVTLEQWKQQIDDLFNAFEDDDFNVMWNSNDIMSGTTELTMPKKLSECKNGWILVFGDTSQGSTWNYCYIPRTHASMRSEEHTSELQSRFDLVCRLLLEKKKKSTKFL